MNQNLEVAQNFKKWHKLMYACLYSVGGLAESHCSLWFINSLFWALEYWHSFWGMQYWI